MHISSLGIVVLAVVDQLRLGPQSLAASLKPRYLIVCSLLARRDGRQAAARCCNALVSFPVAAYVWLRLGPRGCIGIAPRARPAPHRGRAWSFQRDLLRAWFLAQTSVRGGWSEDWTELHGRNSTRR